MDTARNEQECMTMNYKAAIFDLDGTLIDSIADLADSANDMLASYGFPQHTIEEYRYFVGNGSRKLVERCLPAEQSADPAFVDKALECYDRCYGNRLLNKTRPYEGILPMLEELQKKNIPLAICTNKQQFASDAIVEKLFPPGMFRENIGDREGMPRKPDPTKVLRIATDFGVTPEEVAYLGDTSTDMETARNAGFLPVGVTWGFRPREELEAAGAGILLESPMELLEKVMFSENTSAPPVPRYFFVDYENVSHHGLEGLPQLTPLDMVCIFYSDNANSMTFEMHASLNQCKAEIQIQKVETGYKNALDFQLSTCLGSIIGANLSEKKSAKYFIVTKDAAFSCVSKYWKKRNVSVKIVSDITGQGAALKNRQEQSAPHESNVVPRDLVATVRSLIRNAEDAEFALQCIRQYKTKQAVHTALQKKYGTGQAVHDIYQAIKSLLKD